MEIKTEDLQKSFYFGGIAPQTKYTVDQILTYDNYEVGYCYALKMPIYAAEVITDREAITHVGRAGGFKTENRIPAKYRHTSHDYTHSGEDRGHLHSAADNANEKDMEESFNVANVVPELHKFNAGVWLRVEEHTRDLAKKYHDLYVITAPIFKDDDREINELIIPDYVYKAVLIPSEDTLGIYLAPNNGSGMCQVLSQDEFEKIYNKRIPMPACKWGCKKSIFALTNHDHSMVK